MNSESKKTTKAKRLYLAMAVLLAAGGLWLARSAWRAPASPKSSPGVDFIVPGGQPRPGHTLRPPDPIKRFRDLTPEERVKRARQGPIGG